MPTAGYLAYLSRQIAEAEKKMNKNRGCNCNERVKVLEKRVEELSETLAHHLAHKPTLFLAVG
jgi:hypothetical protein